VRSDKKSFHLSGTFLFAEIIQ